VQGSTPEISADVTGNPVQAAPQAQVPAPAAHPALAAP
jgi:hypothetical protein